MQALEFETKIDKKGRIFLPEEFQHAYGKSARLLVLLPEYGESLPKTATAWQRQRNLDGTVRG
jgi:DNA-binding transcriptional regulator/RsmH inhibitor MraZ